MSPVSVGRALLVAALGVALAATLTRPAAATAVARPGLAEPSSSVSLHDMIAALATAPELAVLDAQVAAGDEWRITTPGGPVRVWRPRAYDPATAAVVVYVHGYYHDVDRAWFAHRLPQQFARAGVNALFIACDGPVNEREPVRWPSLNALLATVRARLGLALPRGPLVAIGHSAGYRTLEYWLANRALSTVVLLDGAYGDLRPFWRWTQASRAHRLIDVGDDTRAATDHLHRYLPATVHVEGFGAGAALPPAAVAARVLYVGSTMGHMRLVTGGVALPMILRALGAPPVPDLPWAPLTPLPPT